MGSGRAPRGAVLGEPTAWDDRVEVGGVWELPAPGVQDAGKTREIGPDAPLVFGKPFAGSCRGVEQGLRGRALRRADKGAQGCRDGAGDEQVRPGTLGCPDGDITTAGLYAADTVDSADCRRRE